MWIWNEITTHGCLKIQKMESERCHAYIIWLYEGAGWKGKVIAY